MLKRRALRKIIITTFSLLTVFAICIIILFKVLSGSISYGIIKLFKMKVKNIPKRIKVSVLF